jgi:hypothetical protein
MYPYIHPKDDLAHLRALYAHLGRICSDEQLYARPVTVMNRQTINAVFQQPGIGDAEREARWRAFVDFLKEILVPVSDIQTVWTGDTCGMWQCGFGHSADNNRALGGTHWLVPGDMRYADKNGQDVLRKMDEIPHAVHGLDGTDLAIGEIALPAESPKQHIDDRAIIPMLCVWFPNLAQKIRGVTSKPRSEFFAISDYFLK